MARAATVKKAANQNLPTMQDMGIPEIQEAGAKLLHAKDQLKDVQAIEKHLNEKLVEVMKANGKDYYLHDGLEIELIEAKTKAKVKHKETAAAID